MHQLFGKIRDRFFGRALKTDKIPALQDQYGQLLAQGNASLSEGEFNLAIERYREAAALLPSQDDAYLRLGYALSEAHRPAEAREAWLACLKHNPTNIEAHYLLGEQAFSTKEFIQAANSFCKAIEINPSMQQAYLPAATALIRAGDRTEALATLKRAVYFFSENSDFHFYLGDLFAESGYYDQSIPSYQKALALKPDHAAALAGLGNSERHCGQTTAAVQHLTQAISINPDHAAWHSDLLFTLQYTGSLPDEELFQEHLKFARRFEQSVEKSTDGSQQGPISANRRLKIGYVSGDFRSHSLAFFFEPVLRNHDRERVEVHCYYSYPIADDVTLRLKSLAEHWQDCADLSDSAMASLIREDKIDVLIDLSGHTGFNRLGVFARRAARTQMTWLGYQATTGLSNMDFRLTDGAADPIGRTERYHTEKLIRLSSGAIFQPMAGSPDVNELPADTKGIFTFACLNNPAKMTSEFIDVAAQIIARTPNCQLLLGNADQTSSRLFEEAFERHGASIAKIKNIAKLPIQDFLKLHHQVDMALDTFPYNGGTTTMHSLWMGVPVLALEGDKSISRVGSETMRGLGLPEFSCSNTTDYIQTAVNLAANLNFMRATRSTLRSRLTSALISRAKEFTAELEDVFIETSQRQPEIKIQFGVIE